MLIAEEKVTFLWPYLDNKQLFISEKFLLALPEEGKLIYSCNSSFILAQKFDEMKSLKEECVSEHVSVRLNFELCKPFQEVCVSWYRKFSYFSNSDLCV